MVEIMHAYMSPSTNSLIGCMSGRQLVKVDVLIGIVHRLMSDYEVTLVNDNSTSFNPEIKVSLVNCLNGLLIAHSVSQNQRVRRDSHNLQFS